MPTEFFNFTHSLQSKNHSIRVVRYALLAGRMFKVQNSLGEIVHQGMFLIPKGYSHIDKPSSWVSLDHPQYSNFEKAWCGRDGYSLLVEGNSSKIVSLDSHIISSDVRKNMPLRVGLSSVDLSSMIAVDDLKDKK